MKKLVVPKFNGIVAYSYYDQGLDMDLNDAWNVKISGECVEFNPVEVKTFSDFDWEAQVKRGGEIPYGRFSARRIWLGDTSSRD